MGRNRVSDDLDHVVDAPTTTKKSKKPPLWHFLLDTTIVNSYKIINTTELRPYAELRKHGSHKLFRMDLIQELYDNSVRIAQPSGGLQDHKRKELARLVRHAPAVEHGKRVHLSEQLHYCISCSIGSRIARKATVRKPLQNLSLNSVRAEQRRQRPSKTSLGCGLCAMFICKEKSCWREHLEACIASNSVCRN